MMALKKFMINYLQKIGSPLKRFNLKLILREETLFGDHLLFLLKNIPSYFDFTVLDEGKERSISTVRLNKFFKKNKLD